MLSITLLCRRARQTQSRHRVARRACGAVDRSGTGKRALLELYVAASESARSIARTRQSERIRRCHRTSWSRARGRRCWCRNDGCRSRCGDCRLRECRRGCGVRCWRRCRRIIFFATGTDDRANTDQGDEGLAKHRVSSLSAPHRALVYEVSVYVHGRVHPSRAGAASAAENRRRVLSRIAHARAEAPLPTATCQEYVSC